MKKTVALILVCLMVPGIFASCTKNHAVQRKAGESAVGSGSSSITQSKEETLLKMAVMTGMKEYFTLADNYMKEKPDIKIEIQEYPTSEYSTLLKAKLAGGDCWDVFADSSTTQPTLAAAGHLADLSGMTDVISRYQSPEMVKNTRTFNGIIAALPAQYQYMPLYYNKAMFAKLRLKIPTNWNELLDMIRAARNSGVVPISAGFKENWMCLHSVMQFAATTVQRDDIDWGVKRYENTVTFEGTKGWATAFDKFKVLIKAGAYSKSAVSTSDEQAMMAFLNGESLCYFNGTWGLNAMLKAKPEGFEFGGFRFPINDPGEVACTSTSVTGDFSVWAKSPNLEEAKKWLGFTLSPEQNLILNKTKGPSPFVDVKVPLDPSLVEFEKTVADSGGKVAEWALYQQKWPEGMPYPEPMYALVQELFYPELARNTADILREMDKAWDEAAGL